MTPAQLMHFYEKHLRGQAAARARTVVDMLAAVSAMGGVEFVQQHLDALNAVSEPSPEGDKSSYTKGNPTNTTFVI